MNVWERSLLGALASACVVAFLFDSKVAGIAVGLAVGLLNLWLNRTGKSVASAEQYGSAPHTGPADESSDPAAGSALSRPLPEGLRPVDAAYWEIEDAQDLVDRTRCLLVDLGYALEDAPSGMGDMVPFCVREDSQCLALAFAPPTRPAGIATVQSVHKKLMNREGDLTGILVSPKGLDRAAEAWCRVYPRIKVLRTRHLRLLGSGRLQPDTQPLATLCDQNKAALRRLEQACGLR